MNNFRTFNIAVEFYRQCRSVKLKGDARNQLDRAARSIALNLAEGRGKRTRKDQRRFFDIAMGSLRECQAVFMLEQLEDSEAWKILDKLAAHMYNLLKRA
ncbi:MAG: four helix bundle protein [Bdellovibrionales bacterium]|nr:four helix bundle protein [Bdellovibrionales bacterium]